MKPCVGNVGYIFPEHVKHKCVTIKISVEAPIGSLLIVHKAPRGYMHCSASLFFFFFLRFI